MIINIISFTQTGISLSERIADTLSENEVLKSGYTVKLYTACKSFEREKYLGIITAIDSDIYTFVAALQERKEYIIFIGAMGIAVRAIAAGLCDKLTDSPVIVIDELAQYVIPLVAGHVGGANELSIVLAGKLGAIPVITTATDIENRFPVDLFAKENKLAIMNKEKIAAVSAKALEGRSVRLSIAEYPPEDDDCDVVITKDVNNYVSSRLVLCPKSYALGIGCKKDTDSRRLKEFILENLVQKGIDIRLIGAIASIDLKSEEKAINDFADEYRIPFITFSKEILNKAKGQYDESKFVKEKTGVGNVCERAAMMLTGNRGTIILHRIKKDGMTMALAVNKDF